MISSIFCCQGRRLKNHNTAAAEPNNATKHKENEQLFNLEMENLLYKY